MKSHNLYVSQNIIRVIKSQRMRWARHVACIEEMKNSYETVVRKPERRDQLTDLGEDGRIILKWILGE
jgi:hypothetical protein